MKTNEVQGKGKKMGDIITKLHISMSQFMEKRMAKKEDGFTTAELLANAALGVVAIVAIWGALQLLGVHVIDFIKDQMGIS